jgi:formylglycine-generating enzyme
MVNAWQGEFPWQKPVIGGYEGTSPAGSFPPNGYGLHDMAGNVWEWTSDWYEPRGADPTLKSCPPNCCFCYRPAARQPQMIDTGMANLGFRCVVRLGCM